MNTDFSHKKTGHTENIAENLKYMRSAVERTRRDFDPGIGIFITWGFACLIGYTAAHFLGGSNAPRQDQIRINIIWLCLYAIAIPLSIIFGYRSSKKLQNLGISPYINAQIGWIFAVMIISGTIFGNFGLGRSFINDIHFFWAWIYAVLLSMTGIVYSKEWLAGGVGIFIGIIAAVFLKQYAYLVLGLAIFLSCMVPAIITKKRLSSFDEEKA